MIIHVLIQCSKKKSLIPKNNLIWSRSTELNSWKEEWVNEEKRFLVTKLYSGRSIKKEFDLINSNNDIKGYVISAGAGLIRTNDLIPSYESTFLDSGPNFSQWHQLPHGGLSNLEINSDDKIVSFSSPSYHRALLADPDFSGLASKFVVAQTSPLSENKDVTSIPIHPRTAEYLGIAYIDLNSEILKLYLEFGEQGLNEICNECESLPPLDERRTVSNNELISVVESLESISSITKSVEYIRHTLGISASYERIRETILFVRNKI